MKLHAIATGYTSESLFFLFSLPQKSIPFTRAGRAAPPPHCPPLSPAPPSASLPRPLPPSPTSGRRWHMAHPTSWARGGAWSAMAYGLHGAGRGGRSLPNFHVRRRGLGLARDQAAGAASTARGQATGTAPAARVAVRPSAAPTAALTHGSRPACTVSTRAYYPPA